MANLNIEKIVIGFLTANQDAGFEVFGDMPSGERPEGFVLVDRTGGPRDNIVQDRSEILIEVYHKDSRESASDEANRIADIIPALVNIDAIMRAQVTSIVKLDDLLGQYWRYQVYCDVYYRRGAPDIDVEYPVIPDDGSRMAIGEPVEGAAPLRLLNTNSAGELADDQFGVEEMHIEVAPDVFLDGNVIRPASFDEEGISFGGIDLSLVGIGKTVGVFSVPDEVGSFVMADIDETGAAPPKAFIIFQKTADNELVAQIAPGGLNTPGFAVAWDVDGMIITDGSSPLVQIDHISDDDTFAGDLTKALMTGAAIKAYIDSLPSGGGVWGGITGNIPDQEDLYNILTALQGGIDGVEAGVDAVEGDVSTLQTEMDTAQSDIDTLQSNITSLDSEVDGKVAKTGDTMTGNLTIDNAGEAALLIDRGSSAVQGLVRFLTAGANNWYFGLYDTTNNDFHIHLGGGGGSQFIIRALDNIAVFKNAPEVTDQTASTIAHFNSSKRIESLSTSTYPNLTELARLKGVTSAVQTQLDAKLATALKGASNGVAELDGSGLVPTSQLPSYVDDVIMVANFAALPGTGASGKIYVTEDTNITYRWNGSSYTEISSSLALGETIATAYRGDRGKIAYDHSQITSGNPHGVTKADVGLSNADNTADTAKPVSTAQAVAIAAKQDTLVSGTNIKTVNGESVLGAGDIAIANGIDWTLVAIMGGL